MGALKACLADPQVTQVVTVGRSSTHVTHPKLEEIPHKDLFDMSPIEAKLSGFDAGFFCLGHTSAGLTEAEYTKITYDLTFVVADALSRLNPNMTFVFVSGTGSDSSEKGPVMWARVKGRAENAILKMKFRQAFVFRPAFIEPLDGIQSKTKSYRVMYTLAKPLIPLIRLFVPSSVTTTRQLGKAMIEVAANGFPKVILESSDLARFPR